MKNYKDSDYAANKYSPNIVYRFADETVEVTLADYLKSNPGKTEQDFAELKALSDEIYHEQVIAENRASRLNVTMNGLEETEQFVTASIDVELIERDNKKNVIMAAKQLLDSGDLTATQRRRFILHFINGFSYRQIADMEKVFFTSVAESVAAAADKLKKYFKFF